MAELIKWGTLQLVTYDLIMDFKKVLKKALYNELIEQAFEKAPPYLQLYSFMMATKKWPMLCLTAMEWDNMETIRSFKKYVELHYPKLKSNTLNQHAGWTMNSNMAQKYIHYFGNESSESLLEAYSIVT